jgi:hypothetical protein
MVLLPSFINLFASCHLGSNAVNFEDSLSFAEDNPSSFPDHAKHQAYLSLGLSLSLPLLYVLDCALKYSSLMKP